MRVTFTGNDDKKHRAIVPYEDAGHVLVPGMLCPTCRIEPLRVKGTGKYVESSNTYAAHAVCAENCGAHLGTLRVQVNTLFGIEEDERVFASGIKIY
jgi:hypothetical protein